MKKILSMSGWAVLGCIALAVVLVVHQLTVERHRPALPVQALPTGATLMAVDSGQGPHLVVSSLQTGGIGAAAGLRVGDEIEDVDGLPAPTLAAFDRDIASGSYQDVDLRIRRGHALMDIHLKRQPGSNA